MPKIPKGALEALSRRLMETTTPTAASPLSTLIATRLGAQLEALQQGPLSGLQGVNLPAAYAGDQRSLQAARRRLNAAETGIESPSRRKFVKQAAATAARSALPDGVGTGLLKKALSDAVSPAEIPAEALQAAAAAAMEDVLKSGAYGVVAKYPEFFDLTGGLDTDGFRDYLEDAADLGLKIPTEEEQSLIDLAYSTMTNKSLAERSGIPVEHFDKFFNGKNRWDLRTVLDDWFSTPYRLRNVEQYSGDGQLVDNLDYDFPYDEETHVRAREAYETGDEDHLTDLLYQASVWNTSQQLLPYSKALGSENLSRLEKLYSNPSAPGPSSWAETFVDEMFNNDDVMDALVEHIEEGLR